MRMHRVKALLMGGVTNGAYVVRSAPFTTPD